MAKGSSKAGGGSAVNPNKSFSEMTVAEKRGKIKDFEKELDSRFKHQEYEGYKIYNIGGQYAAYKFNGLSDSFLKKARNTSYFAVDYDKTLKGLKSRIKQGR